MSDGQILPRRLGRRTSARILVSEDGEFEGYASLFEQPDQGRDIVQRGAFQTSLGRRGARGVKMLFQHDPNQPIGFWREIREDRRGLYVRGQLLTQIMRGHEVWALMRAGVLDGLSIGFKAVRARRDRNANTRRLEIVDLWEISVVTFPMLETARVGRVKTYECAGPVGGTRMRSPDGHRSVGTGLTGRRSLGRHATG